MDVTCTMGYYNIFMTQFMQTLGVFGATLVTATIGYPVVNYYARRLQLLKQTMETKRYNTRHYNTEESDSE